MARMARAISSTGIYHVMLRGIDKREIFVQPSDYEKFLWYVQIVKEKANLSLFAYCLMTNHVHLLLKTDEEEIGDIIKCIAVGYAQYHNIKYGRTGHLFQNRFRSETVDNDNYFLTVLRYIHQNPVKAGLVNNISDYRWSSYGTYIYGKTKLVDTKYALGYFKDIGDFSRFMRQDNADECLEYVQKKR
jgi:putative transposase